MGAVHANLYSVHGLLTPWSTQLSLIVRLEFSIIPEHDGFISLLLQNDTIEKKKKHEKPTASLYKGKGKNHKPHQNKNKNAKQAKNA